MFTSSESQSTTKRATQESMRRQASALGACPALLALILYSAPLAAQKLNWAQETPKNSPTPRAGATMVFDAARGQIVLFGGYDPSGPFNDTWVWDGTNWTQMK